MKIRMIQASLGAALCIAAGITGCAAKHHEEAAAPEAAAPLPSGTVGAQTVSATAVVKAIDQKTRHVTLQRADGSLVKFRAGDNVRNLAQVKVGDVVTVTYYEALAYQVMKAGSAQPGAEIAAGADRAKLGDMPGGAAAQVTTITATIAAIDKAAGTVTLRGPEGGLNTIKVRYPEKLNQVSVGDLVQITYTEALGISVEKPTTK